MDDDTFKTELLSRLDKIQALLTYLCGAMKSSEERAKAEAASKMGGGSEQADTPSAPGRSLLQEEMQENYQQAAGRWKAGKE